ncbi:MAG: dipeptide ABC transporter ATP-binding protein [Desulfobacteraceae bacterium]|nr:MAG: dipeptide ABC transporter ATP-binding protein [Desulfobacteraceae bacterium]
MTDNLLEVRNLKMYFPVKSGIWKRQTGVVHAVDDISFSIKTGETVGLVGESGCGKTTVGRTIMRLYKPTDGDVIIDGKNLKNVDRKQMRDLRKTMQMIFQDPFESLNSRHTVGEIIEEPFIIHRTHSPENRKKEVAGLLEKVGLPGNASGRYPHEFSGGQRQRIGIARAIALKPSLIICDEPVSALDVSIQSQVLNLLLDLQNEMKLTYLFIAHDLSVVKHISDWVAVMYLGKIVEYTDADSIYENPLHPYTQALISAIPIPDPRIRRKKKIITGDVPSPITPPLGCRFHTRCPFSVEKCRIEEPKLEAFQSGMVTKQHLVACHFAGELKF